MNYLKSISKILGFSLLIILGLTFFITILSYFNILNYQIINILKLLIIISSIFSGGLFVGKKSLTKGWLEGLKFAGLFLLIVVIFNYLGIRKGFETSDLLYYMILIITGVLGSIVGINLKKA